MICRLVIASLVRDFVEVGLLLVRGFRLGFDTFDAGRGVACRLGLVEREGHGGYALKAGPSGSLTRSQGLLSCPFFGSFSP